MKHLKMLILLTSTALVVIVYAYSTSAKTTVADRKDYVPDDKTAIKVAEAIWLPIYGKSIYQEQPFKAVLIQGIWHVQGTLHTELGGTANIEIQELDCKILSVSHGK